jgi:hypothetical protein
MAVSRHEPLRTNADLVKPARTESTKSAQIRKPEFSKTLALLSFPQIPQNPHRNK